MKSLINTLAWIFSSQASFAKEPTQEIPLKVTSDGFDLNLPVRKI